VAPGVARVPFTLGNAPNMLSIERGFLMDNVTIIQIVAGVLFVIVLVILIQRRRTKVK
jgi:hypothetical protein